MLDHTPDPGLHGPGRVGPNAILQLEGPVRTVLGDQALGNLLECAGVAMPTGDEMIPEGDVVRVHQTLNRMFPERAQQVRVAAGTATGAYIRANRIPRFAQVVLRLLPAFLGERFLTKAILLHAWTFCGSGNVSAHRHAGAVTFDVRRNPLVDCNLDVALQCDWHAAVFRDLYTQLLRRDYHVEELCCCGSGAPACQFRIQRA